MTKKKIIEAKDIFERNEREERARQFPQIRAMIGRVNLPPVMIQKLRQVMEEEERKSKQSTKFKKGWELTFAAFIILIMITVALGCIWLIKIFLGGIFG